MEDGLNVDVGGGKVVNVGIEGSTFYTWSLSSALSSRLLHTNCEGDFSYI